MGKYISLLTILSASCSPPAPAVTPPITAQAVETTTSEAPSPVAETEEPPAPPPPPIRIRYDLGAASEHAEFSYHGSTIIDLGGPAGAKYTMGGWRTSVIEANSTEEQPSHALVRGTTGKLFFGWHDTADARIRLRIAGPRSGSLTLTLNDEHAHEATLSGNDEWQTIELQVPASHLQSGENTIQFRVRRTSAHPNIGRYGIRLDWVQIGQETGFVPLAEMPPIDSFFPQPAGVASIQLPTGWGASFSLRIPNGSSFRGINQSETTSGRLGITMSDGTSRLLNALTPGSFDIDLDPFRDRIARIDITATDAPVTLVRPAVVTPHEPFTGEIRPMRNVLIYLIDTLRADKLAPYNENTRVRTPGLRMFMESALAMLGGHSQENWTKPSVATLLTSLMPWEHTATRGESVLPSSVTMISELLSDEGFRTGAFIANGYVSDRFGFHQGWGYYRNYIRERRRTDAEFVAADALRWLDGQPEEQPFFLYVHTIDPHVPYRPPDNFLAMYDPEPYRGPVSFRRDATLLENIKVGNIQLSGRDRHRLEALYDGEISYHDVHFQAILEGLERRGHADDTIVIVTSDHGEEFWDHGSVGHGHSVYEELLHVPLFVRIPGVTDGMTDLAGSVGLVDVMPTILDALTLESPETLSGESFLDRLLGRDERVPPKTVSGFMEAWRTIVEDDMKLIQHRLRSPQIFDLRNDPREERNIAEDNPIMVRHLRAQLGIALFHSRPNNPRRQRRRRHTPEQTTIDPTLEAQLRALGYIGTSRPQ